MENVGPAEIALPSRATEEAKAFIWNVAVDDPLLTVTVATSVSSWDINKSVLVPVLRTTNRR